MNDETDDQSLFDLFRRELLEYSTILSNQVPLLLVPSETVKAKGIVTETFRSIRGSAKIVGLTVPASLASACEEAVAKLLESPAPVFVDHLNQATTILSTLADVTEDKIPDWNLANVATIDALMIELRQPISVTNSIAKPIELVLPPTVAPVKTVEISSSSSSLSFSLFDLFRDEVRTHVSTMTDGLLALETELTNPQKIEPLMRAAHSIKGAARIVSIDLAVELAHVLEDVFVAAQKGKLTLQTEHIDTFLAATDAFGSISTISEDQIATWQLNQKSAVQAIKVDLQRILDGETFSKQPTVAPAALPQALTPPFAPVPAKVKAEQPPPNSSERPNDEPVVRVTAARLNRLMGLAGESLVQARWLPPFAASLIRLKKQQDTLGRTLDVLAEQIKTNATPEHLEQLITDARNQLNECHQTVSGRIGEFEDRAAAADDLNSRLYREVIASRMRPFADGTHSFPRLVRDMAKTLGKQIRLDIVGQATDVDRDILEKLESPLTHMIRNAVDHGIELPHERKEAGKKEQATIRLEARHRAGTLAISVSDDGRGIDPERVRQKIVDRGMVTPEMAVSLSETELLEFLFLPGFSTAANVSEYSGRGVGLDVVQEMIRVVGGTVRITSKLGIGTTFHLQLPITLSVVRAVLVIIAGESYAFPHNRIDRLLRIPVSDVKSLENRQYISVDGQNIGLVLASQILDLGNHARSNDTLSIVLLSDSSGQFGLIVDSFTGEQDLVVRPLDPRLGKVPNIAAAAILDDGLPVLIADVEDMIRSMDSFISTGTIYRLARRESSSVRISRGNVLVVDDSSTVREVEKQLLKQMGLHVTLAQDGQDGWNKLRAGDYDLIVTDIDMPRMTGLELLRLIRTDAQYRNIPVIVVSYKDRDEDRQRGLELGANYYLMKSSFHDNTFVRAVQSLIGQPN